MSRKPLPAPTETGVLVQSRRRCCICFGLNRDTQLKAGQIAHLDQKSSNNAETNLAFLCFEHHDEYDSVSSQRKNLTIGEVKQFRTELYESINKAFTQQVHFGEITTPASDPFAGSWIRVGSGEDGAELNFTPLPDSFEGNVQYYVSGLALYGTSRPYGPNLGILEFTGELIEGCEIVYARPLREDEVTTTWLRFIDGMLEVTEENWLGAYGMNASFRGKYIKAV